MLNRQLIKRPPRHLIAKSRYLLRLKHDDTSNNRLSSSYNSNNVPQSPAPIPPAPIHRVTYEYPPLPKPQRPVPKESTTWRRHLPLAVGLGGLLWAGYAIYYFFGDKSGSEQTVLTPDKFTTYRITNKQSISNDTCLIEIAPKYAASASMLKSGATLWNGKRLWSIQVKHPMIQIARNYTPLPVYFMQPDRAGTPALMRIMGTAADEGRMTLLVKRYADGEMSRYLHSLPLGSDIEIRGPFIEHQFPYELADMQPMRQPMLDNPSRMAMEPQLNPDFIGDRARSIAMFTAGTGIATALQLLLNPHNPPRGFVDVYHSCRSRKDIPFDRFQLFLESVGRAKFHFYIDNENKFVGLQDIPEPGLQLPVEGIENTESKEVVPRKYNSALQQFSENKHELVFPPPSEAIVCGPPGYVAYISGDPGINGDAPIGGLLGAKGWKYENVKRMLDI